MRKLRSEDFETMAKTISDDYLKHGTPLSDGVVKTAEELGLNPDQIKNLVQMANTLTHLTLFENKNDGDKIVEFEPADPFDTMKRIYKNEVPLTDTSCDEGSSDSVTDFFGDFPDISKKVQEVVDKTPPGGENERVEASPAQKSMLVIKVRKVASDLEHKKLATVNAYREELDKLASAFAHLYGPNFEEFEKDAIALRGELAHDALRDLRACLRLPEKDYEKESGSTKIACVIDSGTSELKSLDRMIKIASEFETYKAACEYCTKNFGGLL